MNTVTVTKLPKSKLEIKIEMPSEDFEKFSGQALDAIAKDIELEGFRKGTAPRELVKNKVGDAAILDRAARLALEDAYPKAVAQSKFEPLGYPEIEITKLAQGNPFEFKATVTVFPEVKLPDYKQIASGFSFPKVTVTDEDIKRLKMEKERHEMEHARQDLMAKISQAVSIDVPEVLVERETAKMVEDLKERTPKALNMSFEDYLKKINKTEVELSASLAKENEKKIANYLILQEIAKTENIQASEEEVAAAVNKSGEGQDGDDADKAQIKEYYQDTLKTEKVFEFLEGFFKKD